MNIVTYNPQSNPVERFHRDLGRMLIHSYLRRRVIGVNYYGLFVQLITAKEIILRGSLPIWYS